jgi:AcrR family transcriptional regulator
MNESTRREREQQNMLETIIATAEELFCSQGYENTLMDDIARVSEYTKRTIYKYFVSKEDLFFAVALKGYQRLMSLTGKKNEQSTGYENIRSAYYGFYEFYIQFPKLLQLINRSGMLKSTSANAETPYMRKFMDLDQALFGNILSMFQAGRADGSIRADVDLKMLAFSSVYMATGFFQMLSQSGDTYTNHFGMDKDSFVKFSLDMMLETLRNRE